MMLVITVGVVLLASSALSRNVPNFADLDEEDHVLFRAAYEDLPYHDSSYNYYETPSHIQDYDNQIPVVKLDLLKDGMWALKAKMLQLKAFNKAMAANLLSTKLKLKELIEYQKNLPKHHHMEDKPVHNYQPSSPPAYEKPIFQYSPPAPQYTAPAPQYPPPANQYIEQVLPEYPGSEQYPPPASAAPQRPQYSKPAPPPAPAQDSPPQYSQAAQYTAQHYGAPEHDPYYGQ